MSLEEKVRVLEARLGPEEVDELYARLAEDSDAEEWASERGDGEDRKRQRMQYNVWAYGRALSKFGKGAVVEGLKEVLDEWEQDPKGRDVEAMVETFLAACE